MPKPQGIYLGRFVDNGKPARDVQYAGTRHLITIGPNGSGKGTGLIMPTLSDLRRSILIIDPKGEAAAITARKRASFGRVVMLNPFDELAGELPHLKSHGFNPLLALDPDSDHFPDDATAIAEALVRVEGKDPHWAESAQQIIAALVMYERMTNGEQASLGHVRQLLTQPSLGDGEQAAGFRKTVRAMYASGYSPLQAKCGRFMADTNEIQSVLSTAITQTNFLDSPPIARDLAQGTFDFGCMKREVVTVYLILPAFRLHRATVTIRSVGSHRLREKARRLLWDRGRA